MAFVRWFLAVLLLLACPLPVFALRPQLDRAGLEQALTSTTAGGLEEHPAAAAEGRAEALAALQQLLKVIPTLSSARELDWRLTDVVHEAVVQGALPDWEVARALAILATSTSAKGSPHVVSICEEMVDRTLGFWSRSWFPFFRQHPVPAWQFHPWMTRTVMVNNPPAGIHTHPSSIIAQIASLAIRHLGVAIQLESSTKPGERISALDATGLLTLAIRHNARVTLYARSGTGREAVTAEALSLMKRLLSDRETLEGSIEYVRYDGEMKAAAKRSGAPPEEPIAVLIREWLLGNWHIEEATVLRAHERYGDVLTRETPEMEMLSKTLAQPVVQRQIAAWETSAIAEAGILEEVGSEPSPVPIDEMVAAAGEINAVLREATAELSPTAQTATRRLWLLLRREEIRSGYSDSERWQRQRLVDLITTAGGLEELAAWPVEPAPQTSPSNSTTLLQAV